MRGWILALGLLLVALGAQAQNLSGSYSKKSEDGDIVLELSQAADGSVTGSFNEGGSILQIEGTVIAGKLTGKANSPGILDQFRPGCP